MGFGFPAVIAVSTRKHKYSMMRSSFSEKSVGKFLNDLLIGRASLEGMHVAMKFSDSVAWDGLDAKIEEEYYDFDDEVEAHAEVEDSEHVKIEL